MPPQVVLVSTRKVHSICNGGETDVRYFLLPKRKYSNQFDSEDDDSDDDSVDTEYDTHSNNGGTKKIINKGRWNKEEVSRLRIHSDFGDFRDVLIEVMG